MKLFPTICIATTILFSAPAMAAEVMASYAQWQTLRDTQAPLPSLTDAYRFLSQHPGWPQEKTIRSRAEASAMLQPSITTALFCKEFPPITGRGMIACLQAGVGDMATREAWLHQAWRDGDFNADQEAGILATFGAKLTAAEHRARLNRLLYEKKIPEAKRMLPHVAPQYQLLAEARMALIGNARNAIAKLHNVPAARRGDPGLLLARIEWRARQKDDAGVVALVLSAPAKTDYADLWWPMRAASVRQCLKQKQYDAALKILAHRGELSTENNADALFLNGWIRMSFKGDARTAYKEFYALYNAVETPVSKARAAYWAGRGASKNGNAAIAAEWYGKAAAHPTVFYGQLAQHALDEKASLDLPDTPAISDAARQKFAANELAQVASRLTDRDDEKMLPIFLKALTEEEGATPESLALVSELASKQLGTSGGVKIAKLALRQQVVLLDAGWPVEKLPGALGVEPALALSIIRQESEFNPDARSGADARGLMQILPGTGAHVAKKLDLRFTPNDLWDGERNVTLGSTYLGQLISGFDGSYILGIAAYNAGPSNVRQWIATAGWPPKDTAGAVNWIESIPFAETRNYVMRVLENLQIYRQLQDDTHPLDLTRDLAR